MSTAQERPPVAPPDEDESIRHVDYRTDAPAYTLTLPLTIRLERAADGQGFTAELPDRTITAPSLWDLCRAVYCEFEDAHDIRAADAVRDEPSEPFDWQPGEGPDA